MRKIVFSVITMFIGSIWAQIWAQYTDAIYTDAIIVKYDNNGDIVWKNDGNGCDSYSSVATVPDGVVAVGSSFNGSVIVKYDDNGNVVWEKKMNGYYYYSVAAVPDGVVIVGGLFKNDIGSAIILKYDNNGNVVWEKNARDREYNDNTYISVTAVSDGIVTAGISEGGGYSTSYIVKYDNKGNIVWKKSSECFDGCSIAAVSDGVVAGGSSYPEAIIIKYDNKGNVIWKNRKKIGNDDKYSSLTPIFDGVLAVGKPRGDWDHRGNIAIVKYDSEGDEIVWQMKRKSNPAKTGNSRYYSLTAVPDGVVAIGVLVGSIYKNRNNFPIITALIAKYNDNGKMVWENYGNDGDNYTFVTAIPDGVIVVGSKELIGKAASAKADELKKQVELREKEEARKAAQVEEERKKQAEIQQREAARKAARQNNKE